MKKVIALTDKKKLFEELCSLITLTAAEAIGKNGRFSMALAGGKTPRELYETLSSSYR